MYRHLKDDNLRMQKELESTIYNLKAQVSELERNGKVASLNPRQHENYNLSQFDNIKTQLLQLRVSFIVSVGLNCLCDDCGLGLKL